jgi:hypothetical protein
MTHRASALACSSSEKNGPVQRTFTFNTTAHHTGYCLYPPALLNCPLSSQRPSGILNDFNGSSSVPVAFLPALGAESSSRSLRVISGRLWLLLAPQVCTRSPSSLASAAGRSSALRGLNRAVAGSLGRLARLVRAGPLREGRSDERRRCPSKKSMQR